MGITPLYDRVIVKPADVNYNPNSLIIIPDTVIDKPLQGTVIAVGGGTKDEPTVCKVGDNVLYGKYSGSDITIDGKKLLIMRESEIFAII